VGSEITRNLHQSEELWNGILKSQQAEGGCLKHYSTHISLLFSM